MNFDAEIATVLDALPEDATADQIYTAMRVFENREVMAAIYERVLAGGGGGGDFNGGTITDPLVVTPETGTALTMTAPSGSPPVDISTSDGGFFNIDTNGSVGIENAAGISLLVQNDGDGDTVRVMNLGGIVAKVLNGGALLTGANAAPSDDELLPGHVAIWFDPTNGAAKVKFKARQANGTVVVGEVALT